MKIFVSPLPLESVKADLLAVPTFCKILPLEPSIKALDAALNQQITKMAKLEKFTGEANQALTLYSKNQLPSAKLMVYGLGEAKHWQLANLRTFGANAARMCLAASLKTLAVGLPKIDASTYRYEASPEEMAQVIIEGVVLGTYQFNKYQTNNKSHLKQLNHCTVICENKRIVSAAKTGALRGQIFATATAHARDLVNEPPSVATPQYLESFARKLLKGSSVRVQTYNKTQLKKLGMNAFLAVAQGSPEEPLMIRINYTPKGATKEKPIVLIGKGVTFDSGGLSIKPAKNMETMKDDMAGAAAIIGAMYGISQLKLKRNVTGIICATSNMIDSHSIRPGDIVKSAKGKTIEILNTDAEGRLTLADALHYACSKVKPAEIIDLATLTGACLVAFGNSIGAALGNSEKMVEKLINAGDKAGEAFWQLPLFEEYRESLKSDIADLKNIGGPYAGTITAALFLKEFVAEGVDWVHLDIAGPAWSERDGGHFTKGGTGVGVRTLLNYLML